MSPSVHVSATTRTPAAFAAGYNGLIHLNGGGRKKIHSYFRRFLV